MCKNDPFGAGLQIDPFQVSIILRSLQDDRRQVNIDIFSLLKIKFHLAQVIGFFPDALIVSQPPVGHAFQCPAINFGNMPSKASRVLPASVVS